MEAVSRVVVEVEGRMEFDHLDHRDLDRWEVDLRHLDQQRDDWDLLGARSLQ
jgi:hypothetical protein